MGLDEAWTKRTISNALVRQQPTYEEKEYAAAREAAKIQKANKTAHAFLKRRTRVRHKPHKSRHRVPRSGRPSRAPSASSGGAASSKQVQSARGRSEDFRDARRSSPRFADYEMDTGRASGVLCAKRRGPHEWADMQSFWHKETQDKIQREKQAVKNSCLAFRVGLGQQMLERERAEEVRQQEGDADRELVLRDAAEWQKMRAAEKLRRARQFRENRAFITQQITAIQEEKRRKLLRTKRNEQQRVAELKRAVEEETQRNKSRKLAEIEQRRQLMIENQRTKEQRARAIVKERACEDERIRLHAEKLQRIEDERRAAVEAKRMALLERETIALARSKGVEEKMREDELRAECDRQNTEREREHQIRERDDRRRKLIEDIERQNSRLLEHKRSLERKERQQATELAERLQREHDIGSMSERKKREALKRQKKQYADDLRKQIESEHRRRCLHPEAMTATEREINASLLKRVC